MDEKKGSLTTCPCYPIVHNSVRILMALTGQKSCDQRKQEYGMTPSEYIKQMLMSTQERIDYLLKPGRSINIRPLYDNCESQCFKATPRIVLFQQFIPGSAYNMMLTIRNVTKMSRHLKISRNPDPFFSVEYHGSNYSTMVAPGLVHIYNVRFNPAEKRDYEYRVEFVSDAEIFVVPVIAIGPRPILDIPDRIEIPATAVKIPSSKTILVRNIGDMPAIFNFSSDNPSFSVEPSKGILGEEETMQLTANFLSEKSGEFKGNVFLNYESGEKLCLTLQSLATNCTIRIDRGSVRMEDTYLGLSRSKLLTIHNRSDYVVKFQWMRFKDKDADMQRKEEYKTLFQMVRNVEMVRCVSLAHYNICLPDIHELICQRIYTDEIASLMNENFHYNHMSFLLMPEEGEIWPQSSTDITVFFRAMEVGEISSVAYLEVTGREDRIALSLHGIGKGPTLHLNVVTIDVKNIFLCSVHNYEIVAANKGHISGTLIYKARPTDFGGTINVTPCALILKPDEYKSFNLTFSSNRKGDFIERIDFVVKESLEILSLHIKGCIVCPTLHFDKSSLDFGTIALGFSKKQEVYLRNLSLVPVSFSVTVMEDGNQTPLTYEEFAISEAKPSFPTNPREFTIIPQKGVVEAHSSLKLKVIYTANIVRSGRSNIRVDMWDSDSDPVILPISFRGAIPSLSIKPTEISIRFSFINFPYARSINVENNSDLDGYFHIIPQAISENIPIVYSLSSYQGFLKARQSKTIDTIIITKVLGKQTTTLNMLTMGKETPVTSCTITCSGQGPVVSVQPTCLNFGEIQVLQHKIMNFRIINDSPISAQVKLTSRKKKLLWLVEPASGEIGPNKSIEIEVKIFLYDAGKYADNIIVHVINSRSIPVNVIAIGIGSSIVFEPQIFPIFDMGFLFSHQNQSLPITMKNFGTRNCQILWSNDPEVRIQRSQESPIRKFQIEPLTAEIPANGSIVIQCKICWEVNEILTEQWYVFGQISGQGKRELIGTSVFKATFTEPRIAFNKRELTFRIDICPEEEELQQTDELVVTNQSRLNLNVLLYVDAPFYLINDKKCICKRKIILMDESITSILVKFSPNINFDKPHSQNYTGTLWFEYEEHPNKDKIQCKGAVNFPNIKLLYRDLIINSVLGSSVEKSLRITNNGPVPVVYKFLWAGESIEIQRKDFTDSLKLDINTQNDHYLCEIKKNLETQKIGSKSLKSLDSSTSYDLQTLGSENLLIEGQSALTLDEKLEKLRNILSTTNMSCLPCLDDPKILALIDSNVKFRSNELLDDILDIVPHEGTLVPYSSQYVRFIFHGYQPMQVKVVALCEILRGPTEIVNVFANADIVQYSVDRQVVDFGQQLFGEVCRSSFTLENHSIIFLDYKINKRNLISCGGKVSSTIGTLIIKPNKGSINPLSSIKIAIEFQPMLLGAFEIEFDLHVANLDPLIITAKGVTSYSQIYLCTSREVFKQHSVKCGYWAIQLLTPDYIAMKKQEVTTQCNGTNNIKLKNQVPEWDERILLNDRWDLISYDEIFPSIIDIEMAIDRFLATQFIKENTSTLIKHPFSHKKAVIPFLYTPEYIIDMGYVTIDLKTCCSTTIFNYGPWNVEVALKKLAKKQLENSGILVQFEKTMLIVGQTTSLTVTWQPTSAKYIEKSTKEEHTIYLEVSRGSTIPVIIKGIITYPFVTVDMKILDFQNVLVGECLLMRILVKNEGFINCCWEAKISSTRKKQEDCPFQLNYKSNFLSPGHSEIINVSFKPRKTCRVEASLKIIVEMGLETQTVTLLGRGVERKLRISDLDINFPPTMLFTEVQEKIFTIENTCDYPVEFFWHHLDSRFLEEERLAEALTCYYGVEEILLPPRKLGERMPSFLMEFYNSLMSEMAYALSAEVIEEKNITVSNDNDKLSEDTTRVQGTKKSSSASKLSVQHSTTREKSKIDLSKESSIDKHRWQQKKSTSYSSTSIDKIKKDCPPVSVFSDQDFPREPPTLPTSDPEELQNLLLCYIETLRKDPGFYERMKDPVKDLFDSFERKTIPELEVIDPSQPVKKICIIFHGAPFTEYQETACRSAKVLQVPLLCIDKIIIEGIALDDNWASIKLRQIIDEAYQEYLLVLEKYKNVVETGLSAIKKISIDVAERVQKIIAKEESPKQIKSPKAVKLEPEATTEINKHIESNAQDLIVTLEVEFAKIPREEDLKFLDPVSLYECKIQTILLLQKILSNYATIVGSKVGEKDQNNTFLGIEIGLFIEILRERLSSDFKSGFILQTLNNIFFGSDVITLIALLNIIGHVEYVLFVTFLNSMDKYIRKTEELRDLKAQKLAEEVAKKIQEIDEMSLSEYELLAEDEKKFYLESTLPRKKQEALQRRMQFVQRMTELKRRKILPQQVSNARTIKNKKVNKKIKDGKTNSQEEKSQTSKTPVNEKEIRDHKEPKSRDNSKPRKQEVSKELENIAKAMNDYYSSLSAIENIIKNWDPLKKDALFTAKNKILKTDKPKDKSFDTNKEINTNENIREYIHIWYINATDPWDRVIYDVVVNQMSENTLAKQALPLEIAPKPDLEPKNYYILKPRYIRKRDIKSNGAYQIVSLSAISDIIMASNSSHTSSINKQENHAENSKRKKRVVDKIEEEPSSTSLNTSIIENKQDASTNAIFEMMLKPRWVLQPNESQRFKIRYQPEEVGTHQQIYALSIIDGNEITYDINIHGVADVPRLDMNPNTIFSKVQPTKINDIIDPTYFSDTGIYDFGSLLVFRKDKSAHRREAELKFCNISKVDAKVSFFLQESNPDIFIMEQEELYIQAGQCELLKISAGVTKLDSFTDKLHICIANNPHVETIELRCNGSKLDIEFDSKLSFNQVLLYRKHFLACFIRNKSPVEIFWHLNSDAPLDPQISFTPIKGAIKPQSDQKIEFCYHASKIGAIEESLIFNAFFHENDVEPIFVGTLTLSGETYDVHIDINHANPIDLKCVKVGFPTSAIFTITNRGHYEVKYVILWEEQNKLSKIAPNLPLKLKEDIEISPTTGSIQSKKEITVQITFLPKKEIILKECPILRCHLLDMNKETAVIAEFPLKVSLVAYYTRFRIYPYPEVNFASLSICTKKTTYLNVENTGDFLLHYSIETASVKHPSNIYMTEIKQEDAIKNELNDKTADMPTKKDKSRTDKKTPEFTTTLKTGPFTITKTEGNIQPGEIDTITVECYPECVGSLQEEIMIVVPDSTPEDRNGKLIKLSVNSCIPSVDLQDLDSMFRENHIVNCIEDFICPKEIGAHTVFVRREKCLYFRYVSVSHMHTAYLVLYNRNVIPADVELSFLAGSFIPETAKSTFVLTPERERIPSMSHKRFEISFNPTFIETCHAVFEIAVELPPHLKDEKFLVKLIGQACVPQVTIIEPPSGKREQIVLNFGRTLVNDSNEKKFTLENIGVISAKVIVEIYENSNFLFTLSTCDNMRSHVSTNRNYEDDMSNDRSVVVSNDRCIVVRLMPGEKTSLKVKFIPQEIGKYKGQVRLFITDNPYENLIIDLKGEAYAESIVLEGLELTNIKLNSSTNEKREFNIKSRKSPKSNNSTAGGNKNGAFTPKTVPVSLAYKLDYGYCFVNKIYRKSFKIVNKSVNRYSRFQWNTHPNVVFTPSIGHLQPMTCKEIIATFLSSEPVNYVVTRVDCTICVIELSDFSKESSWDDRETEVRWIAMNLDGNEQEINAETLAKKTIEPINEPSHEIIPGTTKCIQLLLNAVVAFSKYSCPVTEINFKDSLMFQTREHVFTFSNTGTVDLEYVWQINMDEQYPRRLVANYSRSTPRSRGNTRSRANSSIYAHNEHRRRHNPSAVTEVAERMKLNRQQVLSSRENIIEVKPTTSHCGRSDLFSSSAGLTERSSDSWLESDDLPFEIYPEKGTLPPGESIECTLRFSPTDVFDYKAHLTCKIENLDPELSELIIPIMGRSLLPYCHFDIPESDYLLGNRRDAKLPGPINYQSIDGSLPQDMRVIELNVIGIGDTHVKKFRMINPTSDDYHFAWRDRTRRVESEVPNFHCATPEGIAERGKQVDFVFTFFAEKIGTFEFFWLFSIEKYNLECLFLFVAIVREPSVCCSLVHLKMKPTVLGINVREPMSIINNEEFQLPFQIAQNSLYAEGCVQSLKIMPMNGILNPKVEQVFWIEYQPTCVGEFQFCIKCIVKKLKTPLTIFVTTMTYDIIVSVTYVDQNCLVVRLNQNEENIIDCGKILLKAPFTVTFEITNSSKMTLYYSWDLGMTPEIISRNMYTIAMQEKQGHVVSESRSNCSLIIEALQKTMIKNHPILLKISRGPTYRLVLKAIANKPALEFNFNHYNFGPCYIRDITAAAYHVDLRITNLDDVPYILVCKFEEKSHIFANLDALSEAIMPQSSIIIPIKFRPLEQLHYRDTLDFIINSTIEKKVIVTGEGITYKIRLVNSRDKLIDLGNLSVNKAIVRKVPVINNGRAALELKFDLMKNLPGYDRFRERIRVCPKKNDEENSKMDQTRASITETKRSDTFDVVLQTIEPELSEVLEIEPAESIVLQSGKIVNVIVKYKSMRRMRPFVAKVAFQTNSTIQPLFILRGSCIGAEFRLNRTCVSFGIIVQGCLSEAKVVLLNIGDIGARFKWNTSKLPRDFSIDPATGYCSPGMNVNFIVSFRPTRHDSLIEGDAILEIEKYGALSVKITGGCCKVPDPVDTLFFSCRVREKLTRSLNIENDTATTWKLKPEVFGNYFFVDEILYVPSKNVATCTITYAPLNMNSENNLHKGTLLLKLPDDKAPLVYSLQGLSLAPQVLQKITRQFPAKTKYTELLPVYNWMSKRQRFECKIEDLENKTSDKSIKVYTLIGNSKIDVPPNNQRDYRAEFHSYKESECNFKITFINEEDEYQFYELQYNVTKPEKIESIKLITSVRSPVCHALRLDNPLKEQHITYTAKCQDPCVTIYDVPKLVAPLSSETVGIEYHPLHPSEEYATNLDINCEELGLFPYELRLRAISAPAEKTTRIVAVLGASATFSLTVSNHAKKNATFTIKVNNECFTTPKDIEVPALKSASFDVVYEPCDIDNISATLTATSEIAGEFIFPLIGTYSLPRPQGPYTATRNTPILIPFKNIFRETKSFELILDNPETFVTTTSLEEVKQKQTINIVIRLRDVSNEKKDLENDSYPITGKLMIYCTDPKISHINWTYYLKGAHD